MPDIYKINALEIGNISSLDSKDKGEISFVDGIISINPKAATSGLLFTYSNSQAAYSVRQLNPDAPYSMRVRRETGGTAGDDDEANVKYDTTVAGDAIITLDSPIDNASAGVSSTTLGQFLNVGTVGGTTYTNADSLTVTASCLVSAWYDLSGRQRHTRQATFSNQPQIHNGTVDTDLIQENGQPAVEFDGTDDKLTRSTSDSITGFVSLFTVATSDSLTSGGIGNDGRTVLSIDTTVTNGQRRANIIWNGGSGSTWYYYTSVYGANNQITTATVDAQYLHSSIFDNVGNDNQGAVDGGSLVSLSGTLNTMSNYDILVGTSSANEVWSGYIQEMIFWNTDQTSNRSAIETDVNGFFSIF